MFGARHGVVALDQRLLSEGQAILARRQGRPRFMGLDLIPQGNTGHQVVALDKSVEFAVRENFGTFVFDFDPKRFTEDDWIGDVKAVSSPTIAGVEAFPQGGAIERAGLFAKT